MQFAPICPTAFLEKLEIEKKSRYHMALAQVCLRDAKYYEFYRRLAREDHTVILDNGAYEGEQLEARELCKLAAEMLPTVVVAPDTPHNGVETLKKSREFGGMYAGDIMIVVHAPDRDLAEFVRVYRAACEIAEWVGISRLTQNFGLLKEHFYGRRYQFAKFLQNADLWDLDVKHHALGFSQSEDGNAALYELGWLSDLGFIGCDSSAPIWRGLHSCSLHQDWPNHTFNPSWPSDGTTLPNFIFDLATSNLEEVFTACKSE